MTLILAALIIYSGVMTGLVIGLCERVRRLERR